MSGKSIGVILQLGVAGVMALPLLARSCDPGTVARVGSEVGSNAPAVVRAAPIEDSLSASRVVEGDNLQEFVSELSTASLRNLNDIPVGYSTPFEATVQFVSALPDTAGDFARVFGEPPTAAMLEQVSDTNSGLRAIDSSTQNANTSDELLRSISETDNNIIVLVGHNEDGVLKLASGGEIEISEVAQHCLDTGKRCVILSCESDQYIEQSNIAASGFSRVLTAREALYITQRLDNYLGRLREGERTVSYREIDVGIRVFAAQSEDMALTVGQAKRASKIVLAGGSVGAIAFFTSDEE